MLHLLIRGRATRDCQPAYPWFERPAWPLMVATTRSNPPAGSRMPAARPTGNGETRSARRRPDRPRCGTSEALFRQEFLISAVRFGRGTNVAQDIPRAGPVVVGAGTFIVLQHAVGEFDVERRPARTPLVGRSCDLVDHLVLRVIRRYQEVRRTRDSKPRLAKDRDPSWPRTTRVRSASLRSQNPWCTLTKSSAMADAGGSLPAIQGMPDIAMLAEQPEQLPFVLRQFAPEQTFQLDLVDHPQSYAAQKSRVDACIGDKTPAFGAGICCGRTRCGDVAQQGRDAVVIERLQRFGELEYRFLQVLAILGKQQAAGMSAL